MTTQEIFALRGYIVIATFCHFSAGELLGSETYLANGNLCDVPLMVTAPTNRQDWLEQACMAEEPASNDFPHYYRVVAE
jgi:hypothetical protein